jgi:flagellar protein FlaG
VGVSGGKDARADGKALPFRAQRTPTQIEVEQAVEKLVELARNNRRGLRFNIDEGSGDTVITVYNAATDEIIRQIPSEEILAIARAARAQSGDLLSDRA